MQGSPDWRQLFYARCFSQRTWCILFFLTMLSLRGFLIEWMFANSGLWGKLTEKESLWDPRVCRVPQQHYSQHRHRQRDSRFSVGVSCGAAALLPFFPPTHCSRETTQGERDTWTHSLHTEGITTQQSVTQRIVNALRGQKERMNECLPCIVREKKAAEQMSRSRDLIFLFGPDFCC